MQSHQGQGEGPGELAVPGTATSSAPQGLSWLLNARGRFKTLAPAV